PLLVFAVFLFRGREEKELAHLARDIAGDGSFLRPLESLVHIGCFQNPKSAHVLLGLGVWSVGDEHLAVGLPPHRLGVGGRGNAAGELPGAGSNQFAVEGVDLFHHRFGYDGRIEVVGNVVTDQILWHDVFSLLSLLSAEADLKARSTCSSDSRWGDEKSTGTPIFISAAESAPRGIGAPAPVG